MFKQSEPISFWVIAATVVAIVVVIYIGIVLVKQKNQGK
jgi:type II secretory pathway component PulF